jgi:hypothetical protein
MEILDFKEINKGTLIGYLDIRIPKWGNFEIHGLCIFQKNNSRWITFPTKKIDDKYFPICRFTEKSLQDRFFEEVKKYFDLWVASKKS